MKRIIHITNFFDDPSSAERNRVARMTWGRTYAKGGWMPLPVLDESLPRLFNEGKRKIPYIKDLINEGMKVDGDYLLLTNSDICFTERLHARFQEVITKGQMIFCHRVDIDPNFECPLTDQYVMKVGKPYNGMDLFMFPKTWWIQARSDYPDLLIGREGWDACLHLAMLWAGSLDESGLIYHKSHHSVWLQERYSLGGQRYNINLCCDWMRKHKIDTRWYGIKDIPPPQPKQWDVNTSPPGGWKCNYNGVTHKHYAFDCIYKAMDRDLKTLGCVVPKAELISIIKQQSTGCK